MAEIKNTSNRMADFSEIGSTGLNRYGGYITEEFLPELHGQRGARIYKEMRDNDSIVGAILFAIEMLFRQASWRVESDIEDNMHRQAAEFVQSCMEDMSATWQDTITEILSFLPFGWAWHEIVYKIRGGEMTDDPTRRSAYNDGLIGWRKIPLRSQDTLDRWLFDEDDGGTMAMIQTPPPDFRERVVPIQKSLLFRTRSNKNNPEGRSILRNAYRSWFFKRRLEEIEAIGFERNLAGLPVLTPPPGLDIWDRNNPEMVYLLTTAENLVRNVRRDQMEGIVKPNGWELELLTAGSNGSSSRSTGIGESINRYKQDIAMTVLADFILLGHEKVGSFALSSDKTNMFAIAIGAWLDSIAEVFNRYAIPRLMQLNPKFKLQKYPKLIHGDVETPDLDKLGKYIKDMTGVGILLPGPKLEAYVRQAAELPEEDDNHDEYWKMVQDQRMNPPQNKGTPEDELDPEDPEAQAAAKKRLGRDY